VTQKRGPGGGDAGARKFSVIETRKFPSTIAFHNPTARETPLSPAFARDRAAVVTTAVVRVLGDALLNWFHRDGTDLAAARAEVETILRDEFHDIARTTRDEIRTD
jgi:hypothetical protein